jgi:hypothetical protein
MLRGEWAHANPQHGEHLLYRLSVTAYSIYTRSYPPHLEAVSLILHPENAPCRGDRYPLNRETLKERDNLRDTDEDWRI